MGGFKRFFEFLSYLRGKFGVPIAIFRHIKCFANIFLLFFGPQEMNVVFVVVSR